MGETAFVFREGCYCLGPSLEISSHHTNDLGDLAWTTSPTLFLLAHLASDTLDPLVVLEQARQTSSDISSQNSYCLDHSYLMSQNV